MKLFFIIFFMFFIVTCTNSNKTEYDKQFATVNGISINQHEVDLRLEKDLYRILYNLYVVRLNETNRMIDEKIDLLEGLKHNNKYYVDSVVNSKITFERIKIYAEENKYEGLTTEELLSKYKRYLLRNYYDSVKHNYDITINLEEPMPKVQSSKLKVNYKGNLQSKVIMYVISDLECSSCENVMPMYDSIYNEYKDEIKYAFGYFSSDVTLSSLALECANRQGRFWQMFDSLVARKTINTETLFELAHNINLDLNKFHLDMNDSTVYQTIFEDFSNISKLGIHGTPTIIVNNQMITDPFSRTKIEKYLHNALNKY